jgi:protein-tyrosine phosphatase
MSHVVPAHRKILFLCTGNYYRSRFAEHLFNHLAESRNLPWRADSRGLSNETGPWKTGPISKYALEGLQTRKIPATQSHREPVYCEEPDLHQADLVIALKEAEHRPLMRKRFPTWVDRIEYWHIHDIDVALPVAALAELEQLVRGLADRLAGQERASA